MVHNEPRDYQKTLPNAIHFNILPIPVYCHSIAKYIEVQLEYGELRRSSVLPKRGNSQTSAYFGGLCRDHPKPSDLRRTTKYAEVRRRTPAKFHRRGK